LLRDEPTGLTFNNCTLCPHCTYVFCIYLTTNTGLFHLQHKLIGKMPNFTSAFRGTPDMPSRNHVRKALS